uniref:NADH-ubiquinone oxidoreductase chain 3 n=1 Tax=Cerophytidae sp. BMNH 900085 TaxID=1903808 RepID=A0A343A4I9_9COLE|nr:NADH dehydrogenase subunit 3 [Cerophytidae sp. BMNH 900085]
MIVLFWMFMILSFMIMLVSLILSKKKIFNREKSSPFECGFDPNCLTRMTFSLQFFFIAIIFLIFDIEITLILPMVLLLKISKTLDLIMIFLSVLIILILGVCHEWTQGALNWKF